MIGRGDPSHIFRIVIMQVTFVLEHIDDGFVRVVQIPSMRPSFTTMNLDLDLCDSFNGFSPGHDQCHLSEPVHVTAGLVEMSAPA